MAATTTTTSLRSRLLILPPSPASPAAASHRTPAARLRLSSQRRSPRLAAQAAPRGAPAAATEEDNEKGCGEGDMLKLPVRSYAPFLIVESKGDKLTGSSGFNNVTGYIFGNNASSEKIPMTTPVFTQTSDDKLSNVSIQIVLPMNKDLDSSPAPNTEAVTLRKVEGGIAAVKKFSGRPKEEVVLQKEKDLRSHLLKDGLKPQQGCLFARYNDPRTQSFLMRNEVLIWLDNFTLEEGLSRSTGDFM